MVAGFEENEWLTGQGNIVNIQYNIIRYTLSLSSDDFGGGVPFHRDDGYVFFQLRSRMWIVLPPIRIILLIFIMIIIIV